MDIRERNRLIEEYLPLCRTEARRFTFRSPLYDQDDLAQVGVFGLLRAAARRDPDKNFAAYARFSVRNAMKDFLRSQDFAPVSARRSGKPVPLFLQADEAEKLPDPHGPDQLEELLALVCFNQPPRTKAAVRMRFAEGMKLEEIGAQLGGLKRTTVCLIIKQAIGAAQRRMEKTK